MRSRWGLAAFLAFSVAACGPIHDGSASDGGVDSDGGAGDGGAGDGGGGPTLFAVEADVKMLTGSGLQLALGGEVMNVDGGGGHVFETELPDLAPFAVEVIGQPTGQMCATTTGRGFVASENVRVEVRCYSSFFVVDSGGDAPDVNLGNGICETDILGCTLRAAIMEANGTVGVDDLIVVPEDTTVMMGSLFTCPDDDDVDNFGNDLDAVEGVTRIVGMGVAESFIDGDGLTRWFQVHPGATLVLENLTLQNGNAAACVGAGMLVNEGGTAILNNVIVRDTVNAADFGALANQGTLRVFDSRLTGNSSVNTGGALGSTGVLEVRRSLLDDNEARSRGGAIFAGKGNAVIANSTLSGNISNSDTALEGGGAIYVGDVAEVNVEFSTIHRNQSMLGNGGGVFVAAGGDGFTMVNTILAGNSAPDTLTGPDCSGMVKSAGHNLLGDPINCSLGGMGPGDIWGGAGDPLDPMLFPLGINGMSAGHLPMPGSDAVGNADPARCPKRDQGQLPRTEVPSTCEIGAFERQ